MSWLVVSFAFAAGFLLVFGVNLFLADFVEERRKQIQHRLDEEFRLRQRERAHTRLARQSLEKLTAEDYAPVETRKTLLERLSNLVSESGLALRPAQLVGLCAALAAGALLATELIFQNAVLAIVAAAAAGALPAWFVTHKRSQRRERLLAQLPDAFDLMSRVLRAGQTISQALQSVADEFPRPISQEFGYCWEQQNLGLSTEAAMRDLARRTGLLEIRIFVVAMMIHRQTGGNFSDLLDKLAKVIRERYRIRGQIKTLTAEGRFQAYILLALPIALLAVISLLNPEYIGVLFARPILLGAMFLLEILGALWMRRIVRFDF